MRQPGGETRNGEARYVFLPAKPPHSTPYQMTEAIYPMNTPLVRMQGIRKAFGDVVALHDVGFELQQGEIHGLLGGNGAGKTTLMNILYGLYTADAGEIYVHGEKVNIRSPRDAINHGIGMVHQHFLQVPPFTVAQNIVLGTVAKLRPTNQLAQETERIRELAHQFGLDVDPDALIEDLPVGVRQRVEILKALYRGVDILILDEPTTNLTPQEVDALFQSLRAMVEKGLSVVFITHKIREVMAVCDRVTVLRDGQNVFTRAIADASEEELVRGMVGEQLDVGHSFLFAGRPQELTKEHAPGEIRILVDDLHVPGDDGALAVRGCTFEVRAGEIFGIAGVAGNGQRELAESLMGIRAISQGRIVLNDLEVTEGSTPSVFSNGVAYIPEDRLEDGFLPTASVAHNLILGYHRQPPYRKGWFLDWKTVFRVAWDLIREYNIRTTGPDDIAANLSGGNIQRLMLARAFAHPMQVLIAHNPTRGLDIPSMEFVYHKLLAQREQGTAILLISEDLDELMLLCDRIGTMYKGEMVGILDRGAFDKYAIGRMMGGVT